MPLILFDIEMAGQLGHREDPISVMRKLGYPSAELVAGHPSQGATLMKVETVLHPLPPFLSEEEENSPAKNKPKIKLVKKDPTSRNQPANKR